MAPYFVKEVVLGNEWREIATLREILHHVISRKARQEAKSQSET